MKNVYLQWNVSIKFTLGPGQSDLNDDVTALASNFLFISFTGIISDYATDVNRKRSSTIQYLILIIYSTKPKSPFLAKYIHSIWGGGEII